MKKLHKFLKIGLPIIGTAVVGTATAVGVGLGLKHTSSIGKTANKALNAVASSEGIEMDINTHLPSICSKWGTIALCPKYPKSVMDKFGGTYAPDGNGVEWPHLIANSVSKEDILKGNVKDEDLLTFDQMMPNVLLAKLIAEDTLNMHSTSTVIYWQKDETDPSKGRWINSLAETTNAKYDVSQRTSEWWQTEFNARATFYSAANHDNDSQTTCRDVDQLLCSVLMNPFLYDSTMYSADGKTNIYEPSYNHIYTWDLSNNYFTTIPKGLFQHVNLNDTNDSELLYLKGLGFYLNFESTNICAFNPMELFGDRKEHENETWETRNEWFSPDEDNSGFNCDVWFDLSRSKINPEQTSWVWYAGQNTRNTAHHPERTKYGWNFLKPDPELYPGRDAWELMINTLDKETGNIWTYLGYDPATEEPMIGPIPIEPDGDWQKNPANYGLGPDDTAHISDVVMTALTDNFKHANIWASNEVYQIIYDTLDCIVDMDWISLPVGTKIVAKGSADDINGKCSFTINRPSTVPCISIETTFNITGFNESKSALILSITLTIIFILVLAFSINTVYRNFHPKLSKDELKLINEINSTNRLNKIRKMAEQRASREESKEQ